MGISEKAMLVHLNISGWSGRRHDEQASREVAEKHGASVNRAGRYNKRLIDPRADSFRAVAVAADRARKYHYEHTLPWSKSGAQMLPAELFFEYAAAMQSFKADWEKAVRAFVGEYTTLRERAKAELNGLYRASDYPTVGELTRRHGFEVDFFPIPAGDAWTIQLDGREAAIAESIDRRAQEAAQASVHELARRILEPVQAMAEKLADPAAIFRDSLIENVREIVALAPKLNILSDSDIAATVREIERKLARQDAQTLRTAPDERTKAAASAEAIARKMRAFLGASR